MALGKKIKEILRQKNMTVKELAEKTEIPPTTLYSFINRDSKTGKIDFLNKICTCLDIEITDLIELNKDSLISLTPYSLTFADGVNNYDDQYAVQEQILLEFFRKLNSKGKGMAINYVEYLSEKPENQMGPENP